MITRTRIVQRCTRVKFTLFAALQQIFSSPAATALRRHGNDLGATIKYLRTTTSGAAGIGLGTTLSNYLRSAAGNGRAHRSSSFDAQRALPRTTAWAAR
jgi:hypothetical protein